jgi:hypothetical protein
MKRIELQNIHGGAVIDLFDEEWRKVIANIEDENTAPDRERSVTIKIAVKPDKTRRTGAVSIQAYSALAKIKPAESVLFFGRDAGGRLAAYEDEPGPELPGISEAGGAPITPFPRAVNGG